MLADDFVRLIPLNLGGPGVPTGDPACQIEQDDRVVFYSLDHHAEALLAFLQGRGALTYALLQSFIELADFILRPLAF